MRRGLPLIASLVFVTQYCLVVALCDSPWMATRIAYCAALAGALTEHGTAFFPVLTPNVSTGWITELACTA